MANITITIPDASLPRVVEAMCVTNGLAVTNTNAKGALITFLKQVTIAYEREKLHAIDKTARATELATLNASVETKASEVEAINIT